MQSCLDHLVVVAPDLETGAEFVKKHLDVEMEAGGKHPYMGTWNLLLSLGGSAYLEVIAIDPSLPRPDRPRWFDLDRHGDNFPPALFAWVARTTDIRTVVNCCTEDVGDVVPMVRGDLEWLITIPVDGVAPLGGAAPVLIEWPPSVHPTQRLKDRGVCLNKLEIFHNDPLRLQRMLDSIGFAGEVVISPSDDQYCSLRATIATPKGLRCLGL